MFMGEYSHTIDTKGRLTFPSKLREEIGDSFVVTRGLDKNLYVYSDDEWAVFQEGLAQLSITNANGRKFARFFQAGAARVEVDKQGRILLPQNLREHASLTKDVLLFGMGKRIEIWSKEKYDECAFDDIDDIAAEMENMGIKL